MAAGFVTSNLLQWNDFEKGDSAMENQTNNEKKVQELKEKMNDSNFELDIDALEDAAGGEYVYVDTTSEEYLSSQYILR
jgi:hypothetical protein